MNIENFFEKLLTEKKQPLLLLALPGDGWEDESVLPKGKKVRKV
jgi:hypothetical protein